MIVVGIDPGLTGGLAFLDHDPTVEIDVEPMPVAGGEIDLPGVAKRLVECMNTVADVHVALERSQAFPKMGVCSAFNYGASYWGVLGICAALALPVTLVPPAKWHRALIVGKDGSPKDRALITCQRLFPAVNLVVGKGRKAHAGIVDALLVGEYVRRQLNGGSL